MGKIFQLLFCIITLGLATGQPPTATLFDQPNCQGNQLDASDQPQDLGNFGKRTASASITGVWLFHEDVYHDYEGHYRVEGFLGTNKRCVNLDVLKNIVSSARRAGNHDDTSRDTVNIFPWPRYRGIMVIGEEERFAFMGAGSVIITGRSNWSAVDRSGNEACLVVPNNSLASYIDDFAASLPHFDRYPTFKKGCTSNQQKFQTKAIQEGVQF